MPKKLDGDTHPVYALTGDGELQEGQIWEAVMFAAHNKVDNLLVAVDFNQQQIDGSTADVMGITELVSKFRAFGWITLEMDGNDWDDIHRVMPQAQNQLGCEKPVIIIMKTEMGQGVDFMMGSHAWHGKAPNDAQLAEALLQLPVTELGDY
jgi:transketolase